MRTAYLQTINIIYCIFLIVGMAYQAYADDPTLLAANIRKRLTPLEYYVTQEKGTEPAFNNPYWSNTQRGIYVDVVNGEVIFSSLDKYDAKTGRPSFTKPIAPNRVILRQDKRWFTTRTEVVAKDSHAHLGYLFNDGPPPLGTHYSINSAALTFIPFNELESKGYGRYRSVFFKKQIGR